MEVREFGYFFLYPENYVYIYIYADVIITVSFVCSSLQMLLDIDEKLKTTNMSAFSETDEITWEFKNSIKGTDKNFHTMAASHLKAEIGIIKWRPVYVQRCDSPSNKIVHSKNRVGRKVNLNLTARWWESLVSKRCLLYGKIWLRMCLSQNHEQACCNFLELWECSSLERRQ